MVTIYIVSEGVPHREQIVGELPLQRCIDELGLDPGQRVQGLRESAARFGDPSASDERRHVVASVGVGEASRECGPGYYWLDLTPVEAIEQLSAA